MTGCLHVADQVDTGSSNRGTHNLKLTAAAAVDAVTTGAVGSAAVALVAC
jgi:hypothetical protein